MLRHFPMRDAVGLAADIYRPAGDTPLGAAFIPPLSSVHQNWHEGGMLLARKALALVRGERVHSETLPSRLVLRAT